MNAGGSAGLSVRQISRVYVLREGGVVGRFRGKMSCSDGWQSYMCVMNFRQGHVHKVFERVPPAGGCPGGVGVEYYVLQRERNNRG